MVVWKQAREFRGEARVSTWIFGIAYRCGLTSVRHETRAQAHMRMPTRHCDEVDDAPERAAQIEWLVHALDQLPFEQRAALQLTYWLGLSCEETAAVMQCPTKHCQDEDAWYARRKLGYCARTRWLRYDPAARRSYRRHRPRAMPDTLCQAVDRSALQIRARSSRRHIPSTSGDFYVSFHNPRTTREMEIV